MGEAGTWCIRSADVAATKGFSGSSRSSSGEARAERKERKETSSSGTEESGDRGKEAGKIGEEADEVAAEEASDIGYGCCCSNIVSCSFESRCGGCWR